MGMWTVAWFICTQCMHWSGCSTTISHVVFPWHNHHQSELQYTQDTRLQSSLQPQNPPFITYMASLWTSFCLSCHLSLHYATTPPHHSLIQSDLFPLLPVLLSLPSNFIPHTIEATPFFSNIHHCLCQSCCMPVHNPPFPSTVCWGCTIPLHDGLPFCSPFLVTFLYPLLYVPGISSLQLNLHFVTHSDLI